MTPPLQRINRPTGRIQWRQVGILYQRELRGALRERNIVVNSIILPIVLYPFMMWAIFSGIMFVQGQTAGFKSRVLVTNPPPAHAGLQQILSGDQRFALEETGPDFLAESAPRRLADGRLDAWLEFLPPAADAGGLADNFTVRITYDKSKERSATARNRINEILDRYRSGWLTREVQTHGLLPVTWQQFTLAERNIATSKQSGALLLGMMLPLFFVIMVAMGSIYPAVDAIAGERERNTWETLISTASNRTTIVTAKYLYVATMGGVAGVLNLTAMTATIGPIFGPVFSRGGGFEVSLPWAALPLLAVAAVLLAGFVAAGMMILASFARTFKEGQAMVMPFYFAIMLPVMFLQTPGLTFSPALAAVPVVNVVMLIRSAVGGTFPPVPIAITLVVSTLVIAAALRFAAFIVQFEDVMLGAYSGNLRRFLAERVFQRARPAPQQS